MPVEISNLTELDAARETMSGTALSFVLVNDIDCSATREWNWDEGLQEYKGWIPFGLNPSVTGGRWNSDFNGNGFKIFGVWCYRPAELYASLFGNLRNAPIYDLWVEGTFHGLTHAGVISGTNAQSTHVRRCVAEGTVYTHQANGSNADCAGFAGVGPVGIWEDCINLADVISENGAANRMAGFAARVSVAEQTVRRCYSVGLVTTTGTTVGAFLGSVANGTAEKNYYDSTVTGRSDTVGATPKTTAQMKQIATFVDWDIVDKGDFAVEEGTATSGGNDTLTDTGKAWTVDEFEGRAIRIVGGTGAGQSLTVASNTATVITVTANWTTNPDNTSEYEIFPVWFIEEDADYPRLWFEFEDEALTVPANVGIVFTSPTSATVSWDAVTGATTYGVEVQIRSTEALPDPLGLDVTYTSGTTAAVTWNAASGRIELRARVRAGN